MRTSVKRFSKSLAAGVAASALAISGLAVALTATATAAHAATTSQLAGVDRYDTGRLAALSVYPTNSNAVLASGENFPDGLASADLAGSLGAPLLLTPAASLAPETVAALAAENVHNIFVVGGSAAVSTTVITQLQGLGYTVTVISGADRYATSAAVASTAVNSAPVGSVGGLKTAIIATGANFPDALAAGSAAYVDHLPILLTDPNTLSTSVSTELTALGIKNVIMMGGTSAISTAVQTAVTALGITVTREQGATRYDTAVAMAAFDITPVFSGGGGLSPANVVLASGLNFPDALVAAELKSPIVLDGTGLPTQTAAWLTLNGASILNIQAVGGTAVIPAADLTAALAAVAPSAGTATFTAVAGGTSFTVTFSAAVNTPVVGNFLINNSTTGDGLNAAVVTQTGAATFVVSGLVNGAPNKGLLAGDVIALNSAALPTNAAGQAVTATSFTVPANAAPAVVSVQYYIGGTSFAIQFNKPVVVPILAPFGITLNGTGIAVAPAFTSADGTTMTWTGVAAITNTGQLTVTTNVHDNQAVALPANVSYSPTANTVPPAISTSIVTQVPTSTVHGSLAFVAGATGFVLPVGDALTISAKPAGAADGALGNLFQVQVGAGAGLAAATVTASTTAGVTTVVISVPLGVYANPQALAAALNANATFNTIFVANGTGAAAINANSLALAAAPLAGGTTVTSVSLILNRDLVPAATLSLLVAPGPYWSTSTGAIVANVSLNNGATPSIITVTFAQTTAAQLIVAGTTTLTWTSPPAPILDFSGLTFATQTVTIA